MRAGGCLGSLRGGLLRGLIDLFSLILGIVWLTGGVGLLYAIDLEYHDTP